MTIEENRDQGLAVESDVAAALAEVLFAHVIPLQGPADMGRDLLVQYRSTAPSGAPIDFRAQVKSGPSFGRDAGRAWKLTDLDARRFREWQRASSPVFLIWVPSPDTPLAFWKHITGSSSRTHLYVSKQAVICPALRYDISRELWKSGDRSYASAPNLLLHPPLNRGIRQFAKDYYRRVLLGRSVDHNLFGEVEFTWSGWRHITHQRRSRTRVNQTLMLLPLVKRLLGYQARIGGFRKLPHVERGQMRTDRRVVVLLYEKVPIAGRPPARIVLALREDIHYPIDWRMRTLLPSNVRRTARFLSVYEKD